LRGGGGKKCKEKHKLSYASISSNRWETEGKKKAGQPRRRSCFLTEGKRHQIRDVEGLEKRILDLGGKVKKNRREKEPLNERSAYDNQTISIKKSKKRKKGKHFII